MADETTPSVPFELELSDFKWVTKNMRTGKGLRCTFTWRLEHPTLGVLGVSTVGCLITRGYKGELRFTPPLGQYGQRTRSTALVTQELHDLILRTIEASPYAAKIGQPEPGQENTAVPPEPGMPDLLALQAAVDEDGDDA